MKSRSQAALLLCAALLFFARPAAAQSRGAGSPMFLTSANAPAKIGVGTKSTMLGLYPSGLPSGIPYIATDTGEYWIGTSSGNYCLPKQTGPAGAAGTNGVSPTISIGPTSALAYGMAPTVANTGTSSSVVLAFSIPAGAPGTNGKDGAPGATGPAGTAATLAIATPTVLAWGATPTATNSGTSTAAILQLGLPASMPPAASGVLSGTYPAPGFAANALSVLGAAAASHTHVLAQISDAGTAASRNIATSGNASSSQVVLGNDTRLSDGRAPIGTASGSLTGSYPSPTIAASGVSAGTYTYPSLTIATDGRITSAASQALPYTLHQLQGVRVAVPSIALGLTGNVTVTWPFAYNDTNFTLGCTVQATGGIQLLQVVGISGVTATGCTVAVKNVSLSGSATGTLHVLVLHD